MVVPLDREWAELVDTKYLRYLKRVFPKHAAQLVGYVSTVSGRMCVGVWVSKTAGLVDELQNYEPSEGPPLGGARFVGYMLHKQNKRDAALAARRKLQARAARLSQADGRTKDRMEFRRRKRVGRVQIMVPGGR